MKLVLLTQDLMIASRVEGAARQLGLTLVQARDEQAAVAAAEDAECQVALVDLRAPGLDIGALVPSMRGAREEHLSIVACGPHVHEAKLAAASQAGCDAVITRGQLDRELEVILRESIERE